MYGPDSGQLQCQGLVRARPGVGVYGPDSGQLQCQGLVRARG